MRITDNFDNLALAGPRHYCTYCWRGHYGHRCGPDRWRSLATKAEYLAYIRQYLAAGGVHAPLGQEQMRMEI